MIQIVKYCLTGALVVLFSCTPGEPAGVIETEAPLTLNLEKANILAELPLACLQSEYPNKLGQTLGNSEDMGEPHQLHPSFFGCFDWHSSVHGHWSLVRLLKEFPRLAHADVVRDKLRENITMENIQKEILYFQGHYNKTYERTYGWAWLLKLAQELHEWDDPMAQELEDILQPLTDLMVELYLEFLPKLVYPIRVGEHTNTAFGLTFAWDYALAVDHPELKSLIASRAKDFYMNDMECPLSWEPSGYDFLSPCLEEIDLMRRVLGEEEFKSWIALFAPWLKSKEFQLTAGEVSDRSDGKLVHLDGLNFSRAWVLLGLARQYNDYSHLVPIANAHINHSLPNLVGDGYEGGHWLGTFAIYALIDTIE